MTPFNEIHICLTLWHKINTSTNLVFILFIDNLRGKYMYNICFYWEKLAKTWSSVNQS